MPMTRQFQNSILLLLAISKLMITCVHIFRILEQNTQYTINISYLPPFLGNIYLPSKRRILQNIRL